MSDKLTYPERAQYVLGFAFEIIEGAPKRVLLLNRTKPGHWQYGRYNGLGGAVEVDETPRQAMFREFDEEAGVSQGNQEWWHYVTTMKFTDAEVHVFSATYKRSIPIASEESVEGYLELLDTNFLPSQCMDNLHWLIPLAMDKSLADFDCAGLELPGRYTLSRTDPDVIVISDEEATGVN